MLGPDSYPGSLAPEPLLLANIKIPCSEFKIDANAKEETPESGMGWGYTYYRRGREWIREGSPENWPDLSWEGRVG